MKNKVRLFMIDVFILSSLIVYLGTALTGGKKQDRQAHKTVTAKETDLNIGPYFPYLNKKLESLDGQDLGRIEQIAFGPDGGANYAVISYEDKLIAVPWNDGHFFIEGDHVVASLSKSRLDSAQNLLPS